MTNKRSAFIGIAVPIVLALVLLLVAPAAAHHKSGHEHGGQGGTKWTGTTEDNDSNDNDTPNNVVDNDDNEHPSGKDKSVEHGNSGNQGNSTSDPDDDGRGPDRSNGGADKPDGPGGVDLADQDGNNGCGNDDDFEDDNEGWCGKNPKKEKDEEADVSDEVDESNDGSLVDDDTTTTDDKDCPDDVTMIGIVCDTISDVIETAPEPDGQDFVLDDRIERPGAALPDAALDADASATGESAKRSAAALPFTGTGVVKLLLVAIGLILLGTWMLHARRRV